MFVSYDSVHNEMSQMMSHRSEDENIHNNNAGVKKSPSQQSRP